MKSIIIKSILWIGVILLAYFGLYANITGGMDVRKVMDIRKSENIQKLEDIRQIQRRYKRDHGFYAENAEILQSYLKTNIQIENTDKGDNILIPENKEKWEKIRDAIIEERQITKTDIDEEARKIYKKAGGKWNKLTRQEEIEQGYIDVTEYIAHELIFTSKYKKNRKKNCYEIDINNLSSMKELYNKMSSYDIFKSSLFDQSKVDLVEKLKIKSIYSSIQNNYKLIFDLDTSTSISLKELEEQIKTNEKYINSLKKDIQENKKNQDIAKDSIDRINERISNYTNDIGSEKISKVKEKAKKKEEKGKEIKGRSGKIFSKISKLENAKKDKKEITNKCQKNIKSNKNEIKAREQLIRSINKNIQFLFDIETMQKDFTIRNQSECLNFNDLAFYTLNKKITITTRIKRSPKPTPSLPEEWLSSIEKAESLAAEILERNIKEEISKRYEKEGGKMRNPNYEEMKEMNLITYVTLPVIDVIFNEDYMKKRDGSKLKLDSLFYIPHSNKKYTLKTKIIPKYENKITNGLIAELSGLGLIDSLFYKKITFGIDDSNDSTSMSVFNILKSPEKYQIIELLDNLENKEKEEGEEKEWKNFKKKYYLDNIESGKRNQFFIEISASYDDIFNGLDEENFMLRNIKERNRKEKDGADKIPDTKDDDKIIVAKMQIGSLETEGTNGNWGKR